jgi:hypothetical protein
MARAHNKNDEERKIIEEGNKKIASYMNQTFKDYDGSTSGSPFYHNSLDWLNPVLMKIRKDYIINIHSFPEFLMSCIIRLGNTRMGYGEHEADLAKAVWLSVIQFIDNKKEI